MRTFTPLSPFVVAVIPTYRRRTELQRLLDSLENCNAVLGGIIVVDNGQEDAVRDMVDSLIRPAVYHSLDGNPGPGAAWKNGMEIALEHFPEQLTHVMTLDDDVVIDSASLEQLLDGMKRAEAGGAAPLICDEYEQIGALGVPEPVDPALRKVIRTVRTREDSIRLLGDEPLEICWCIGPCLIVTKETIMQAGMHRGDFWILGEDVEYAMRVSTATRLVAVPGVLVAHLPPPPEVQAGLNVRDYLKFCALLQNLTYMALRLPASRHLWRYLPGNFRRFLKIFGWSLLTMHDAAVCFIRGFLGYPAGHPSAFAFRARILARKS